MIQIGKHIRRERLRALDLPSLQHRRRRADIIQVFKVLVGIDRIDSKKLFALSDTNTRGHHLKLFKQGCRIDPRKYTFSRRVTDDWNALPDSVINVESLAEFKYQLDSHLEGDKFNNPFIAPSA